MPYCPTTSAKCFHHQAELYLVGGTSLLLAAGRASTFDIDVQFRTENRHYSEFIRCLRTVSRDLGVPVELASPEQFIPLPAGFQDRRKFELLKEKLGPHNL